MSNFNRRDGDFKVTASKGGGRNYYEHDDRSRGPPRGGGHWRGGGSGGGGQERGGGGGGGGSGGNVNDRLGDRYDDRGGNFRGRGSDRDSYRGRGGRDYNRNDRYDDGYRDSGSYRGRGRGGGEGRGGGGGGGSGGKWRGGGSGGGRGRRDRRRGGRGGSNIGGGSGGGGGGREQRDEPTPRSRLEDDDVSMEDGDSSKPNARYNPYGNRRPKGNQRRPQGGDKRYPDGGSQGVMSKLGVPFREGSRQGEETWCKITIPYGKNNEKEWLIKSIQNICKEPFIPKEFSYDRQSAVFYVDDLATGNALRDVSKRITSPSGHKVVILSKPCRPPIKSILDEKELQVLKEVMSRRYDPSAKSLDLGNLYNDQDLKGKLTLVVDRPAHFDTILKIISENIPEMTALHLDANRLYSLRNMSDIALKMPNISTLNLSKNMLKSESELDYVKGLKLKELTLDGNPLCDHFREQTTYISACRSRFPKLEMLDGHKLPPPIEFDLETNTALPPVQQNFFANDQIKAILVPFLERYFKVYDSGDRQPLLDIYHDQASFSISIPVSVSMEASAAKTRLSRYLRDNQSRNLLVAKDPVQRNKLIKQKKVPIIAYLHDLPTTQHDMNSLKIDVSMARGNLLCFTVSGTFIEVGTKGNNEIVTAFSRVFLAMHHPTTGLCIVNDQLVLRPATNQQKASFASPGPTPSTSPVNLPHGNPSPAPAPAPAAGVLSPHSLTPQQQEMVAAFMRVSHMNAEWSFKCLEQNGWNFEESGKIFTNLQSEGKIPPEAFKQA